MIVKNIYIGTALTALLLGCHVYAGLMGYRGMVGSCGKIVDIYGDNHYLGSCSDNGEQFSLVEQSIASRKVGLPKMDVLYEGGVFNVEPGNSVEHIEPVSMIIRFPLIKEKLEAYANFINVETRQKLMGTVLKLDIYLGLFLLHSLSHVLVKYEALRPFAEAVVKSISQVEDQIVQGFGLKDLSYYTYNDMLNDLIGLQEEVDSLCIERFESPATEEKFNDIKAKTSQDLDKAIGEFRDFLSNGTVDPDMHLASVLAVRVDDLVDEFQNMLAPVLLNILLMPDATRTTKEKTTLIATLVWKAVKEGITKIYDEIFYGNRFFLHEAVWHTLDLKVISHIIDATSSHHCAVFVGAAHADNIYHHLLDLGYSLLRESPYTSSSGFSYDSAFDAMKDVKGCRFEISDDLIHALIALTVSVYTRQTVGTYLHSLSSPYPYQEIMQESSNQILNTIITRAKCYLLGDIMPLDAQYFLPLAVDDGKCFKLSDCVHQGYSALNATSCARLRFLRATEDIFFNRS